MSVYDKIYSAMAGAVGGKVTVDRNDLGELMAELSALRGAKPVSKYTAEFEEAWTLYPTRPGNSKAAAFKAWKARLREGFTALEMIEGTARYASYVKAERTEPQFIKQASTFYGPSEFFFDQWEPAKRRAPLPVVDQNRANNAAAIRLLSQPNFDELRTIDEAN